MIATPHLQRTSDELIPTRPLHAIDAEIRPADPDRVLRGPGARRIVFGGHQPVTRIERGCHRRTEIDIPQPHDQVAGVKHRAINLVNIVEIVDAADKLQVAWTPWRIPAHGGHVLVDGFLARRIVPRQRQPDHTRRHLQILLLAYRVPHFAHDPQQVRQRQRLRLIVYL